MLREVAEFFQWDRKRLEQGKVRGSKPELPSRPAKHQRDASLTPQVQLLSCPQQSTEAKPEGKPAQTFRVRERLTCKTNQILHSHSIVMYFGPHQEASSAEGIHSQCLVMSLLHKGSYYFSKELQNSFGHREDFPCISY